MFDSMWQFVLGSILMMFILAPIAAFMIAFMVTQGVMRAMVAMKRQG